MSTLTQAQPGTAAKTRLLSVPLAVTFLAEFMSLTSFLLLLSVMPMLAAAAGVGSSGAGLITGALRPGRPLTPGARDQPAVPGGWRPQPLCGCR